MHSKWCLYALPTLTTLPCTPSNAHPSPRQVDATVKSWNVKILGLNRGSRHRDATVAQEFWRLLDAFLQARSSSLAY